MTADKERIEAAAKYAYEQWSLSSWVVAWADIAPEHRKMWVDHATDLAGIMVSETGKNPDMTRAERIEAGVKALEEFLDGGDVRALMFFEDGWMCIDGTMKPNDLVAAILGAAYPDETRVSL